VRDLFIWKLLLYGFSDIAIFGFSDIAIFGFSDIAIFDIGYGRSMGVETLKLFEFLVSISNPYPS
jgi:hypothetical protein